MCGIAAILSRDGPVPAAALRRATAALRHRGPDAERTWVSPSGRVGLGHTLLVINDPEGHQPIASEDGRLHIIVNGQFYDFARIRAELEARGHRFRTRSDSEIALHLYEDLGAGCLEQLRGQFAFVIWNEETGRLFAARDRFGLKPLFYAEHDGALYLASEAKALFAAGIPRAWDERGVVPLAARVSGREAVAVCGDLAGAAGACVAGGWWRGAAGAVLGLAGGGAGAGAGPGRRRRTRAGADGGGRRAADGGQGAGGVPAERGAGLVGGAGGGGRMHGRGRWRPSRWGSSAREYDESAGAREMAAAAGADHTVVTLGDSALADHFAEAVWHAETLQYNTHGVARYLLARGVRAAGYRSVMAGEGADEAFFGYEFLRAAAGAGGGVGPRKILRILRGLLRSPARHHPTLAAVSPWLGPHCAPAAGVPVALHAADPRARPDPVRMLGGLPARLRRIRPLPRVLPALPPDRRPLRARTRPAAPLPVAALALRQLPPRRRPSRQWRTASKSASPSSTTSSSSTPTASLSRCSPRRRAKSTCCAKRCGPTSPRRCTGRTKRPFMAPSAVGVAGPLHDFLQDTLRGGAVRAVAVCGCGGDGGGARRAAPARGAGSSFRRFTAAHAGFAGGDAGAVRALAGPTRQPVE